MKVHAIIVNYRVAPLTIRAIHSLISDFRGIDAAITVVDNDSRDGSLRVLSREISARGWQAQVSLIASPRNGGFGYGNNLALSSALGAKNPPDFFFLLNSDALVRPGTTRALLDFLDRTPRAGIAGTRLFDTNGVQVTSCFRFPSLLSELESGLRLGPASRLLRDWIVPMPPPCDTCEVDWVSGSSFIIRREALERAGLFDERFFLYYEEIDLCRRVRNAGFSIYHVHETAVEHLGAAATGVSRARRRPRYWFDSRQRYFVKQHGRTYFAAATLAWALGASLHRARRALSGTPLDAPPYLLRDQMEHFLSNLVPPLGRVRTPNSSLSYGEME